MNKHNAVVKCEGSRSEHVKFKIDGDMFLVKKKLDADGCLVIDELDKVPLAKMLLEKVEDCNFVQLRKCSCGRWSDRFYVLHGKSMCKHCYAYRTSRF